MKGGEAYKPPGFYIEVNVARGGQKLVFLRLHHGTTPDSAVEVNVNLNCKTVYFNQLFGDMYIFSTVSSKSIPFLMFQFFIFMKFH
jgi:hypothetical protein